MGFKADTKKSKAYLVGGGLASLASAAYLIKDGSIPGKNITIFEESEMLGGSLDGYALSSVEGYIMRGFRMLEEKVYTCTFDLLSFIPSLNNSQKTVKDEIFEFNEKIKTHSKSRLVETGKIIDSYKQGLKMKDRNDLFKVMTSSESSLGNLQINDHFSPSFFKSNFWTEFCTIFSFQPWHSLAEFRRYTLRFIHNAPIINTLGCIRSTPYNQYESMVLPLIGWLKQQGVCFKTNYRVTNLDFKQNKNGRTVEHICYNHKGKQKKIVLNNSDYVFATLGSMVANSSIGSMTKAPRLSTGQSNGSWDLWKNIAKDQPDFGKPAVFCNHIDKSKWESFTVTFKNPIFLQLIEKFTGNKSGSEGVITFKNSNWLMSMALPHQPHFINQAKNVTVCWGYGLFPDRKGNYVKKKMSECNGKEILIELLSHLGFNKEMTLILEDAICIPIMMPYITSQFLPRSNGDRPLVIPKRSTNFAFIGQYCEIPNEISFTLELSVRSAQIGVYSLLKLNKRVSPLYKGQRNIKMIYNAINTAFR